MTEKSLLCDFFVKTKQIHKMTTNFTQVVGEKSCCLGPGKIVEFAKSILMYLNLPTLSYTVIVVKTKC